MEKSKKYNHADSYNLAYQKIIRKIIIKKIV